MSDHGQLDKAKIKQSFAAAAGSYDAVAALQRQVGLDLLNKFPLQAETGLVMDLGAGTGFLTRALAVAEHQSLLAVDIALPMLLSSRQKNQALDVDYLCADAEKLPLVSASVQQIYSNLALQWCEDLAAVFADCGRVLQQDGQLVLATFGPATLKELKAAWAKVDDFAHVNQFYSLQDINGFLQQAGFSDLSLESVIYQTQYDSVLDLMHELKGLGAHNVSQSRNRKPTTRRQLQQMMKHYENAMPDGQIVASYEIIFVRAGR
jgi:malonyl-CoA O-methyltransferase